uniref:Dolichyl-diphosphooligosaccharide--protein glycosyltransferase subunit 4A n=1 Tax=Vitis vinifera TaxID=29760 RepID=F6HLE1_VITVI
MATEPKAAAENVKIDLLEDDDEFEINEGMFDDQDLGFFANFLGIFIFVLVIAYHYVMADPKYEGN